VAERPWDIGEDRPAHVTPWGIEHIMTRAEAFELVERAKGKTPADWLSWMHLDTALHIVGDSTGGLEAARKAMELNPCSSTLMNVAVILECFGRFDEAIVLAARAALMDPTNGYRLRRMANS
jgi:Flp pilus assembly protein TadD